MTAGCRDVIRDLTLESELPLGTYRRVQIGVHLLICRHCRKAARQLRTLHEVLQSSSPAEARLSSEARARIRRALEGK